MTAPALWTETEAAAATGGTVNAAWRATGVSIDSRTVAPGDLFVALAGPNHDGHDFALAALGKGAVAAMVARGRVAAPGAPLLEVDDTLKALERLGQAARARSTATIVAVTGSVGKTGTKDALALCLGAQGPTHASVGSFNNHWGAPLTLARMPRTTRWGVFELGMNHAGELAVLTRQVRPHVALVTWIAGVHLEFFASVADIARAKAEIFQGMTGGTAILPADNAHHDLLAAAARREGVAHVLAFGRAPGAAARLDDAAMDAEGSRVLATVMGRKLAYRLGAPGPHWVSNSLAVLLAVSAAGGDVERAAAALAGMAPPKGRGRRLCVAAPGREFLLIDESYNASPEAMRAAFATAALIKPRRGGRRVAILGDMRELGREADALHEALAPALVNAGFERVLCCGPHMARLFAALPPALRGVHTADSRALVPHAVAAVGDGDVVVVKGSLGTRMAPIVEALVALGADGRTQGAA
jgi:UDP-N-acetylmuramoyl-tripeptide--D-alanyl-D-alanine ligase